jgi:hypothetical protein
MSDNMVHDWPSIVNHEKGTLSRVKEPSDKENVVEAAFSIRIEAILTRTSCEPRGYFSPYCD